MCKWCVPDHSTLLKGPRDNAVIVLVPSGGSMYLTFCYHVTNQVLFHVSFVVNIIAIMELSTINLVGALAH